MVILSLSHGTILCCVCMPGKITTDTTLDSQNINNHSSVKLLPGDRPSYHDDAIISLHVT